MQKLKPMVSMELDDEDKIDACMPMPCERPDYPYGLKICLTDKEFTKLQLNTEEAIVGGIVHGHFIACITSVSREERDGKKSERVELQIENLSIEAEDEENAEAESAMPRRKSPLYAMADEEE